MENPKSSAGGRSTSGGKYYKIPNNSQIQNPKKCVFAEFNFGSIGIWDLFSPALAGLGFYRGTGILLI